ncbi:hypothetical protein [Streptomyces sp. G7(2002)]|uniref:hypothetical protein n=1 Tax=Streptomyces sp. G7(2002) TaxID=2971798 RepID=UPI00237D7FB9|nr:hypothetical protein [Streptomyces sp. G7(2002)]WDT57255.1 hypothetical protein NUT86_26200 [Streptomyces sp. G7(2002)]
MLFPAADFQVEGLAGAIVEWSGKEFGIPEVAVGLSFDRAANRFLFDWQPHRGPREQESAECAPPGIYVAVL